MPLIPAHENCRPCGCNVGCQHDGLSQPPLDGIVGTGHPDIVVPIYILMIVLPGSNILPTIWMATKRIAGVGRRTQLLDRAWATEINGKGAIS